MKVLVFGGTAFFGRAAVDLLLQKDHEVTIITRGNNPLPWGDQVEHLQADRDETGQVTQVLKGRTFDWVYDNIAMNGAQVRETLDALGPPGTSHYLLTSSGAVYMHRQMRPTGEYIASWSRGELDQDNEAAIDARYGPWTVMMKTLVEDDAPLDPSWLRYEAEHEDFWYRQGKLEAEAELVEAAETGRLDAPFTIIRPPVVEGPRDHTGRTAFFARRVADGGGILLAQEQGGVVFQKIFSEDLAGAIVSALGNEAAYGEAYNIAQEEILTNERYFRAMAYCLDVDPPGVVTRPWAELHEALGEDYFPPVAEAKTASIDKAKRDLGFEPSPYLEWMGKTLDWIFDQQLPADYKELRQRELELMD